MNLHESIIKIKNTFPELRSTINENGNLYYNSIGSFAKFTQEQIDSGDRIKLKLCYALARELMMNGNHDVINAIHVSYLEHLNFSDSKRNHRSYAMALMPPVLHAGYLAVKG
jgi:hypothetical protein